MEKSWTFSIVCKYKCVKRMSFYCNFSLLAEVAKKSDRPT